MSSSKNIINRTSVNEQISEYMREAIKDGTWAIEQKIPSEAELADYFKVSKLTVRVALQQLIGMGILEKRTGDGTYVKKFDFSDYIQRSSDFFMKPELLDQVCDFRFSIELNCCRLAIDVATKADFKELKKIADSFNQKILNFPIKEAEELSDESISELVSLDFRFHRQICVMSHNELLLNAYDMAKEPISQYLNVILKRRIHSWLARGEKPALWKNIHGDIYAALYDRNYIECQKLYIEMIDRNIDL